MKKDSIHLQLKNNGLIRNLRTIEKQQGISQGLVYSITKIWKLSEKGVRDANEEFKDQRQLREKKLVCVGEKTAQKR